MSGTAAVRLGDGMPHDLSADGRWALVLRGAEIAALPTGAGAARTRALPFAEIAAARFLPGDERVVLAARDGKEAPHLFVAGFGADPPRRFGPEIGLRFGNRTSLPLAVSTDGRLVAFADANGGVSVVPVGGEQASPAAGVEANEWPLQWTTDGRLLVFDPGRIPARVHSVDVVRGERRLVREVEPRDPVGVTGIDTVLQSADGKAYVYSYQQFFSDLFVVSGLR
jgi:hypothetical protein